MAAAFALTCIGGTDVGRVRRYRVANRLLDDRWAIAQKPSSMVRSDTWAGVKEGWQVLGPEKKIKVHRQPSGEQFADCASHGPGGSVASTAVPIFTEDLDSLFRGMTSDLLISRTDPFLTRFQHTDPLSFSAPTRLRK